MSKQTLLKTIAKFFESDDWDYEQIPEQPVLTVGFEGHNGKWLCYAQARETEQQVVFYSVLPVNVPLKFRAAAAEFITRVNYGMIIGNFEMDYEDGEIRYKTSVDVEDTELTLPLVRQLVYANLVITDHYLPGLMRVIFANYSPLAALESLEFMPEDDDSVEDDAPPGTNGKLLH